jgi:hypothetical protein
MIRRVDVNVAVVWSLESSVSAHFTSKQEALLRLLLLPPLAAAAATGWTTMELGPAELRHDAIDKSGSSTLTGDGDTDGDGNGDDSGDVSAS